MAGTIRGLNRTRLRIVLGAFFLALAVPAAVLVIHAYDQLKWEAFHQSRGLAEELAKRIDRRITALVDSEERRGFADYQFLVVRGDARANVVGPSPLAAFPVREDFPGLLGYFQVGPDGRFSSPLLPSDEASIRAYITPDERSERARARDRILRILADNELVSPRAAPGERSRDAPAGRIGGAEEKLETTSELDDRVSPAESKPARAQTRATIATQRQQLDEERVAEQTAAAPGAPSKNRFDELKRSRPQQQRKGKADTASSPSVSDLKLDEPYPRLSAKDLDARASASKKQTPTRRAPRKELSQLPITPDADSYPGGKASSEASTRIRTFESELDPFELSLLDDQHMVLYRKVWREGQRWVQGALIERQAFLDAIVGEAFRKSSVSGFSNLVSAWQDRVSAVYQGQSPTRTLSRSGGEAMSGALLFRTRLSAPSSDLELLFTVTRMPAGPGAKVVVWVAAALALVLVGGVALMYRLGSREIDLAAQQQDFVAAVSHELRTPLTSIRMYGEMLREGWTSEEKKRGYYDFIVQESERLSRLIANVLQLARMTRNELKVELRDMTVSELLDGVRSKVTSQAEQAGFELVVHAPPALAERMVKVDPDGFSQIFINLVDNAIKFSSAAEVKRIEIAACTDSSGRRLRFLVRDHGPGIAHDQMKKIFRLFYRSENELTRETVGTGIGLALVSQLAASMNAGVEVRNAAPGAEFAIELPLPRG